MDFKKVYDYLVLSKNHFESLIDDKEIRSLNKIPINPLVLPGIEWIGWKAYEYYVLAWSQIFGEEAVKQFHFKSEWHTIIQ